MWVVAERTRRRLCRAGFVALCVLPTVCVAGWIVAQRLPGRAVAASEALGSQLGARVTIGALREPQPGVTYFDQVDITDALSRRKIAHIDRLEVHRVSSGWLVRAEGANLRPQGDDLWRLLAQCIAPTAASPTLPVQFFADRVTIAGGASSASLLQCNATLEASQDVPRLTVSFRLPGPDRSPPIALELARSANGSLGIKLDTHDAELPASVMALVAADAARLGPAATYRGRGTFDELPAGVTGQLGGRFAAIDLAALAKGALPAELSATGAATLELSAAQFRDGRLIKAVGTLRAGPGTVSPQLIEGAAEQLRLVGLPETRRAPAGGTIAYEQLHFDFTLDAEGLRLTGRCGGAVAGTVMTRADGRASPLLAEAPTEIRPIPVTALPRLFSASTTIDWVPATKQSQWLLGKLPVRDTTPQR
ncbi:MAG: hypothetical protein K8T25_15910 [Planctomycetia bacterium]|nr:hypothetical protein [Planctomycetia bacterium]